MPEHTIKAKIQTLYAPIAWFTSENPILLEGELGTESETGRQKIGDGVTTWSGLPYLRGGREKPARFAVTTPDVEVKFGMAVEIGGTISKIRSAVLGSESPSVRFSIRHGADMTQAGPEVVTGGIVCDGPNVETTTFDSPTVPADSWVWLTISEVSGQVGSLSVSIEY